MPWRDWMRTVEVEPSLYAADFSRLGEQIETLMRAGARIFHFDIGDGHFVPPITIGPIVLQSISPLVHRLGGRLDCHLMVDEPQRHFEAIAEAGGDSVTFHQKPSGTRRRSRDSRASTGSRSAWCSSPETEPEQAAEVAEPFDLVLCMSIEPGYSGQPFMPEALPRIERLRGCCRRSSRRPGRRRVGRDNIRLLRDAGASLFVAGTSTFGRDDIAQAYEELVQEAT